MHATLLVGAQMLKQARVRLPSEGHCYLDTILTSPGPVWSPVSSPLCPLSAPVLPEPIWAAFSFYCSPASTGCARPPGRAPPPPIRPFSALRPSGSRPGPLFSSHRAGSRHPRRLQAAAPSMANTGEGREELGPTWQDCVPPSHKDHSVPELSTAQQHVWVRISAAPMNVHLPRILTSSSKGIPPGLRSRTKSDPLISPECTSRHSRE